MKKYKILVINVGSTSTKTAVFEDGTCLYEQNLPVAREELAKCKDVFDQYGIRRKTIEDYVDSLGMKMSDFDFIASRGTGGGKQQAGAYVIDEAYLQQCHDFNATAPHPLNVGPSIAFDLAVENGVQAYVYDTEGVYEYNEYAELSGNKEWPGTIGCHTLNAKAVARKAAAELGGRYEDYNFVICHLGGGITTSIHEHGRILDSTADAYAPERSGSVPMISVIDFIKLCYSGKYSIGEMLKKEYGQGGLVSYLGTSDLVEIERRIDDGDREAEYYLNGMIYQLAKDIAAMSMVVYNRVDRIILTGGAAHSKCLVDRLTKYAETIAPVMVYPGSYEMEALAAGTLRAVKGEEPCRKFVKEVR